MDKMDANPLQSTILQLDKVCRTCLSERGDMNPLFGACLNEMLGAIAQIEIKENDGLPTQMCMQCMRSCNRAYTFKKQCEKSDSILRDYIALKTQESQVCDVQEMIVDNTLQTFPNGVTNVVIEELIPYESNGIKYYTTTDNVIVDPIDAHKTIGEDGSYEMYIQSAESDVKNGVELSYGCPKCTDTFKLKVDLEVHMMSHPKDIVEYVCDICFLTFPNAQMLDTHCNAEHVKKKPHQCTKCEMSFNKSWNLTRHMNKHSQAKPYLCPVCKRSFKCAAYVTKHMKQNQQCKKLLTEQKAGKKTAKKSYVENVHQCNQCDMSFNRWWNLNRHKMLHQMNKVKPFQCSICERTFETSSGLSGHMKTHKRVSMHVCDYCDKSYVQKRSLRVHLRTHTGEAAPVYTGEKNHICETCGKAFASLNSLMLHKRVHWKEKFDCAICKRKFADEITYNVHMMKHNQAHFCNICDKTFSSEVHFAMHMEIHDTKSVVVEEIQPKLEIVETKEIAETIETTTVHQCQVCDAQYLTEEEMHEHMLSAHQLQVQQVETMAISGLLIDPVTNTIQIASLNS